jgi:hypothetical protein
VFFTPFFLNKNKLFAQYVLKKVAPKIKIVFTSRMINPRELELAHEWSQILYKQMLLQRSTATSMSICLLILKTLLLGDNVEFLEYTIGFKEKCWHIRMEDVPIRYFDQVEQLKTQHSKQLSDTLKQFLLVVKEFDRDEAAKEISCLFLDSLPKTMESGHKLILPGLNISWEFENLTTSATLANMLNKFTFKN